MERLHQYIRDLIPMGTVEASSLEPENSRELATENMLNDLAEAIEKLQERL